MKTEIKYLEMSIDAIKNSNEMFRICNKISDFIENKKVKASFLKTTSAGIIMNNAYIDTTNIRLGILKSVHDQ